ncbi:sugar transferase [Mycetocola sp.]|jgi:exopolysaccharide biosynthesis polyprenyl glycosylphosphotransferase|uniref:sugar transferase n=1 Tax=Mycetocola sp. TaxID=1871042 RepID=UPI0026221FBF|nr:sugar transferase [Mycetocola sp.]MCU1420051.1 polyprenyl glycosylphosphotransferase [Mycetocola sp.]MCU1561183.1 polyprenyl glycosylphosphotransferase [Mycetocola sp.]
MTSVERHPTPLDVLRDVSLGIRERGRHAVTTPGITWTRRYRGKLLLTDCAVIAVAVGASAVLRFGTESLFSGVAGIAVNEWIIALLTALCWVGALGLCRTRESRELGVGAAEYKRVVRASAVAFGLLALALLLLDVDIPRGFFLIALPLGTAALVFGRWSWRRWLTNQRRFGNYLSRALVVGDRADVGYVIRRIHRNSGAAYAIVGAALCGNDTAPIVEGKSIVPVVTTPDNVALVAKDIGADTVIVAGGYASESTYIRDLGWELESTGAELVVASKLTNVAGPRIHFRPVEGLPLMHVELPSYDGPKHTLKRVLDVIISGIALIALLPVMAVIALAIKSESPGPVLFSQERVGRGGDSFRMLKFRSMVQTAEDDLAALLEKNEGSGVLFKMKQDPRVTRVGKFLRTYSLDELPQLLNIFLGDMSVVGPRPPLPREVADYEGHVRRRLYIKPGLTGMWQVNGRSDLDWEESVRLDLYYVENWSFTGDLMIIWRTFRVLIHPVGAY